MLRRTDLAPRMETRTLNHTPPCARIEVSRVANLLWYFSLFLLVLSRSPAWPRPQSSSEPRTSCLSAYPARRSRIFQTHSAPPVTGPTGAATAQPA
jgi:hypothetical protein